MSVSKPRLIFNIILILIFFVLFIAAYPAAYSIFFGIASVVGVFYTIDLFVQMKSKRTRWLLFVVFFVAFSLMYLLMGL